MSESKPWMIIVSGPNGAGKTTFFDKVLTQNPFLKNSLFINSDIEFSRLTALPENQKIVQEMKYDIKQTAKNIRKKLLNKFRKVMESVSGNIHERISKRTEENKGYWQKQFSLSVHIPQEQEYIIQGISSKKDLMRRLSSSNLHERINAKTEKNNWYETYKRFINTVEVQELLYLQPLIKQSNNYETKMQIIAGEHCLNRIYNAFEQKFNIVFETTGAGHLARRFAYKAKTLYHYNVYSFHPYLLHPELSISRVMHRVANGGHDVPKDVILQRYEKSLNNLPTVLSEVNIGIVMDNSGKKPFMPVFAQVNGYIIDFAQCPEYLEPARQQMIKKLPQKSVKELLHLNQDIDIQKMTEEQRENFGQIVITNLLGQIR